MTHHRLDAGRDSVHWGFFDAALPPRLMVESGDTVTLSTVSGFDPDLDDAACIALRAMMVLIVERTDLIRPALRKRSGKATDLIRASIAA